LTLKFNFDYIPSNVIYISPEEEIMCAVLVGGMDRLRNEYIEAAKALGVDLKVFTGQERSIKNQLGVIDLMILFTSKLSHAARQEAIKHARTHNIPLHMIHSSGVSALRRCIKGTS
jgi:hypothetical protein